MKLISSRENYRMKSDQYLLIVFIATANYCLANSSDLQTQLMDIASQEAEIAGIGANKYMMLYGKDNPIPKIERWNEIQQRPALNVNQLKRINQLENTKKQLLQGANNE